MKNGTWKVITVLLIVVTVLVLCCGVSSAAVAKVINVKLSTFSTAGIHYDTVVLLAKHIEQATGGRFKFIILPGSAASPTVDHLASLRDGVFDMSFLAEGYFMEKVPAFAVISGVAGMLRGPADNWALETQKGYYELSKEIYAQQWNSVPVGRCAYPGNAIVSRVPLPSIKDIAGKKIRCGGASLKVFAKMGASVVNIPMEDIYTALSSGLIDAAEYSTAPSQYAMGLQEVAKYWIQPPTNLCLQFALVANKNFWDSVSDADKALIADVFTAVTSTLAYKEQYESSQVLNKIKKEDGVTVQYWSEEDLLQYKQGVLETLQRYPDDAYWVKAWQILENYTKEMGYTK